MNKEEAEKIALEKYPPYTGFSQSRGIMIDLNEERRNVLLEGLLYREEEIIEEKSWDDIIKEQGAYFEVEEGEDTERLDDFITYLKTSYHPPKYISK